MTADAAVVGSSTLGNRLFFQLLAALAAAITLGRAGCRAFAEARRPAHSSVTRLRSALRRRLTTRAVRNALDRCIGPRKEQSLVAVVGPADEVRRTAVFAVHFEDLGVPLADHYRHLVAHGFLHLIGYDHETDAEAERMEALETRVLARLGAADPYARVVVGG